MDKLAQHLSSLLQQLLSDGWMLPFHFAMIDVHGALVFGTYTDAGNGQLASVIDARYHPPGRPKTMKMPINVMLTDSSGRVTGLGVNNEESTRWMN
jgi:hypothetical protein